MNVLRNFALYPFIAVGYIAGWLLDGVFRMTFGLTTLQVLSRLAYFPAIGWNMIRWRWQKRQWYNRIDNTVVLGALPFRNQTEEVREII